MKRNILIAGTCFVIVLGAGLSWPGGQLQKEIVAKKIPPQITSVSQSFDYGLIYLILRGVHFPPKTTADNVFRNIRLVSLGGADNMKASIYYTGQTGNWTPAQIDDFVPMEVLAGRRYRVGLVEYVAPNSNTKTLISNQVEFLLLMKLESVTPQPVPHGVTEIEVTTPNDLGSQGAKIVKLGQQPAAVTQWGGATRKFKFRIPNSLAIPGAYELYVEEGGVAVSNKVQVQLL